MGKTSGCLSIGSINLSINLGCVSIIYSSGLGSCTISSGFAYMSEKCGSSSISRLQKDA